MRGILSLAIVLAVLAGAAACTNGSGAQQPAAAQSSPKVVHGEPGTDETTETMPPNGPPEMLAWDGGTFTWANGVSITTSVEVMEPIPEKKVEFCEGCLTLVRKDLNFALRYTISVPKTFQGTLDTSSCGGSLSVDSGNDDETFVLRGGGDSRDLSGAMRPGSTKYGVQQWGIKKAARTATFVYSNSCGDVEGMGMAGTGLWGGPLPEFTTPQPKSMFKTSKVTYFEVKVVLVACLR